MNKYGYIIGENPPHNKWVQSTQLELLDGTFVIGYEGNQQESDSNVVIIGDSKQFQDWKKENVKQVDDII